MIRDRAHLAELVAWLEGAGVRSRLRGGRRREGAGRVPGRPLAAARDGGDRAPARRDRDPGVSAGPRLHRRRDTARGAARKGAVCDLRHDAALLRPRCHRTLDRRPTRRGHDPADPRRCARRGRTAEAPDDRRAHRGRRHASVPGQERAVRDPAGPFWRLLPAGRSARRARPGARRPRRRDQRSPPLHVQRRGSDGTLAADVRRGVARSCRASDKGREVAMPPRRAGR